MELKRLLTRATALLLKGAYQGAESFIEQAMDETEKLKSELAEIDTLRTRVTEMAAEIERLQSVIDEANAQEPDAVESNNGSVMAKHDFADIDAFLRSCRNNTPLYKHPIPAQQSYEQALNLIAESRENFENQFGFSADADWVYKDLAELFIVDLPVQQSPAVAVPDLKQEYKLFCKWCDENQSLNLDPRLHTHSGQVESGGYIDQKMANVAFKAWRARNGNPSPRITEQDAEAIIESYAESPDWFNDWIASEGRSLLNKLNGV